MQALPRKSELKEITTTPPTAATATAERESSYFGAMWPERRCPEGLRGSAVRHDSSRSMPDPDFHHSSHKPPSMSVADRLRFERGEIETHTG